MIIDHSNNLIPTKIKALSTSLPYTIHFTPFIYTFFIIFLLKLI